MSHAVPEEFSGLDRNEQAKTCLRMISVIALRGAESGDPEQIGYALQELTQVLFERTGSEDRVFEPVDPDQISDLIKLYDELDFVDSAGQAISASRQDRLMASRSGMNDGEASAP